MALFRPNTCGERFCRIDRYGVAEAVISDSTSSSVTTSSVGGGATIVQQVIGNDIVFKTLVAGTDITLVEGPNTIEINATGAGGGGITSIVNAGGDESLVKVGAPPTAELKGLTAGTGISLVGGADDVTLAVTNGADTVTLANAGGGSTLVVDGTGPALTTKSLTAGAGINFTVTANDIAIDAPAGATYSIADAGAGDETLINDGTGPAFLLKKITAGTGITLASDGTQVTVTNAGVGTTPTFTAGVGDEELFDGSPLTTFTPTFKSLSAGAGISLAADANKITITNSAASAVYTLATDAAATGSSIVSTPSPTSADFRVRGIAAGSGITVGVVGADVVVTNSGAGGVTTLANAGTATIVVDGTGPTLSVKGVTEVGSFIHLRDTATDVRWDVVPAACSDNNGAIPAIRSADAATITAGKKNCLAIGCASTVEADNCSAYGEGAAVLGATSTNSTALGPVALCTKASAIAAGFGTQVTATRGTGLGNATLVSGLDGIGIGSSVATSGTRGIGIGQGCIASGSDSMSHGTGSRAIGDNSGAFGKNVRITGDGSFVIGKSDDNTVSMNTKNDCIFMGKQASGILNRWISGNADVAHTGRLTQTVGVSTFVGLANLIDPSDFGLSLIVAKSRQGGGGPIPIGFPFAASMETYYNGVPGWQSGEGNLVFLNLIPDESVPAATASLTVPIGCTFFYSDSFPGGRTNVTITGLALNYVWILLWRRTGLNTYEIVLVSRIPYLQGA
jgi:hypothetical protein